MRVVGVGLGQKLSRHLRRIIGGMDAVCFPWDNAVELRGPYWWVAWDDDGEPAGYAALRVLPAEPTVGYLKRIGVMPQHRGKGLAGRLLAVRIRKARALGLETLVTDTSPTNWPSANNLIKHGFRLYAPDAPWAGQVGSWLYWRKDL